MRLTLAILSLHHRLNSIEPSTTVDSGGSVVEATAGIFSCDGSRINPLLTTRRDLIDLMASLLSGQHQDHISIWTCIQAEAQVSTITGLFSR
jgi:hypothetical protein